MATFDKVVGAVSLRDGGKLKLRSQSGWWRWGKETGRKRGQGVPGRGKSKRKGPGVGLAVKAGAQQVRGRGRGGRAFLLVRGEECGFTPSVHGGAGPKGFKLHPP